MYVLCIIPRLSLYVLGSYMKQNVNDFTNCYRAYSNDNFDTNYCSLVFKQYIDFRHTNFVCNLCNWDTTTIAAGYSYED